MLAFRGIPLMVAEIVMDLMNPLHGIGASTTGGRLKAYIFFKKVVDPPLTDSLHGWLIHGVQQLLISGKIQQGIWLINIGFKATITIWAMMAVVSMIIIPNQRTVVVMMAGGISQRLEGSKI